MIWAQLPPLYAANPVRPQIPDRPCGCIADPLVFGHDHQNARKGEAAR